MSDSGQIFHLYDAAARLWGQCNLADAAAWFNPAVAGLSPGDFVSQDTSLSAPVVHADLLFTAGASRLMHVEYETSPKEDLIRRMLEYRSRIMRQHPDSRLTQYVLVLGDGRVPGYEEQKALGFTLDLQVIYLRLCDPAEFLANPALAPFAVLARGDRQQRENALGAAIRLLRNSGHPQSQTQLQITEALARIRLDPETIERVKKENGMSIEPLVDFYRETEVGHRLEELGRQQGLEQGLEQGLAQGREEGREQLLLALLRSRFGDTPDLRAAAHRLAGWDREAAVTAVTTVSVPSTLLNAEPPA